MEWKMISWKSEKLFGKSGAVWCYEWEDGSVLCIDKFRDFEKEVGFEMESEYISYFDSFEKAKEWFKEVLKKEVFWI